MTKNNKAYAHIIEQSHLSLDYFKPCNSSLVFIQDIKLSIFFLEPLQHLLDNWSHIVVFVFR